MFGNVLERAESCLVESSTTGLWVESFLIMQNIVEYQA